MRSRPWSAFSVYDFNAWLGTVMAIQDFAGFCSGHESSGPIATEICKIVYNARRTRSKRKLFGEGSLLSAMIDLMEISSARKLSADERDLIAQKIRESLKKQPKAALTQPLHKPAA